MAQGTEGVHLVMVALQAPIQLPPLSLPHFPGTLMGGGTSAEAQALLGEVESLCATLVRRRASLSCSARKAIEDARSLKKLGVSADLGQPIEELSAALPDVAAAMAATARAVAGFRAAARQRPGNQTEATLETVLLVDAELRALHDEASAVLRDLETEQAVAPPPAEAAPLSQAFDAYVPALKAAFPEGTIEAFTPGISQLAGELIPILTVRLREQLLADRLVALEQDAHALVAAEDPSLVGLFAIDYVPPASAP